MLSKLTVLLTVFCLIGCNQSEVSNEEAMSAVVENEISDETLLPSDALKEIKAELDALKQSGKNPIEVLQMRRNIAQGYLDRIKHTDPSRDDALARAQIYHYAANKDQTPALYEALIIGDDLISRKASANLCRYYLEMDTIDLEKAEKAILNHLVNFPKADPDLPGSIYAAILNLGLNYQKQGLDDKHRDLLLAELQRLQFDTHYYSFDLVNHLKPYLENNRSVIDPVLINLEAGVSGALAAEESKGDQASEISLSAWKRILADITRAREMTVIVGKSAPELTFIEWLNSETEFQWKDLRGKIILLDFWATWCGPCIKGFPHLRALQEEFGSDRFTVIGVTSFQGRYNVDEISENDISQERELQLTSKFIETKGITWPVAFTQESVFNKQYGISGIPALALLDGEGKVVIFKEGMSETTAEELRDMIATMLRDDN